MDETRDIELAEQAVELEAQAPWPLIEASGLGLATSRGVLFEGIDASVPKGAVCAVLGPYGIKRSALILTLCSRCRFTSGTLRVGKYSMEPSPSPHAGSVLRDFFAGLGAAASDNSRALARSAARDARAMTGIGFFSRVNSVRPGITLLDLAAAELHLYGRPSSDAHAHEHLRMWGLDDLADKRFRELDAQQRCRLGLCLGMAGEPEILAVEDIEVGLAPYQSRHLMGYLKKLAGEGLTVLVGCVDPVLAAQADCVIELDGLSEEASE